MTVSATYSPPQYSGNGVTTAFSFPFQFFATSDLIVNLFDTAAQANVVPQPVLGGAGTYDYTVTGVQDANTGEYLAGATVTFNNAPLGNHRVTITRSVSPTQGVALTNNAAFPAKTVEGALDRLTLLAQQLLATTALTLQFPASDPAGLSLAVPGSAARASGYLGFDPSGNVTIFAPGGATIPISAAMVSVVQAATLALARTALGVPTGSQAQVDAATVGIVPTADQLSDRLQHGQCRLTKSGANLLLSPYNGNKVFIPSSGLVTLPAAGLTLAIGTALVEGGTPAASTTYFIYLSAAGGGTLQASATTHATDATTGIEIRSGDNTRVLVGMARTSAAPAWVDNTNQRFTLSWFNRRSIVSAGNTANGITTASGTATELSVAGTTEAQTIAWGDTWITLAVQGQANNNSAGGQALTQLWQSGVLQGVEYSIVSTAGGNNYDIGAAMVINPNGSEGLQLNGQLAGRVSGGTGSWTFLLTFSVWG